MAKTMRALVKSRPEPGLSFKSASSLRRRVSTLPRKGWISRSGRRALICACRRRLLVAILAREGRAASGTPPREIRTSRGSSRSPIAPTVRSALAACARVHDPWDNTGRFKQDRARSADLAKALRERALQGGDYRPEELPELPLDPLLLAMLGELSKG